MITIFKPFQLACQSGNAELMTIAIDCLGKLFTYNYWTNHSGKLDDFSETRIIIEEGMVDDEEFDNGGTQEMISFVINTICNSFQGENTNEKVQLQIIKVYFI